MLELAEMEEEYTNKFKDFLYSGTKKANITRVALIALSLVALPGLVLVAAVMGNVIQLIGGDLNTVGNTTESKFKTLFQGCAVKN